MPVRFVLALLVFAVSFAVGIGGTYLLIRGRGEQGADGSTATSVPPPERRPPEEAVLPSAGGTTNPRSQELDSARVEAVAAPSDGALAAGSADALAPQPGRAALEHGAQEDAPGEPPADGAGASADRVLEAAAVPAPGEIHPGEPAAEGSAPSGSSAAPTNAWWLDLKGKRCTLALKDVGFSTLSLREGAFEHNRLVDWDREFAGQRRLAVFRAEESPQVDVLALGFDKEGVPTAAYVQVPGSAITGVIALQTEGKRIILTAVDAGE